MLLLNQSCAWSIFFSCLWALGTLLQLQRHSLLCQRIIFVDTNTSRRMELLPAQLSVTPEKVGAAENWERIQKMERTQLLCCILIAIFGKTHVILGLET